MCDWTQHESVWTRDEVCGHEGHVCDSVWTQPMCENSYICVWVRQVSTWVGVGREVAGMGCEVRQP